VSRDQGGVERKEKKEKEKQKKTVGLKELQAIPEDNNIKCTMEMLLFNFEFEESRQVT